jgi:hypothetical protein
MVSPVEGSFSALVTSPGWRAEAVGWATERLASLGTEVLGEVEQPRVRPWSTQLVLRTGAGRVWFKANCPDLAAEAPVHEVLAALLPHRVDRPLAVEADRGWVLTADRGATLAEDATGASVEQWTAVMRLAAQVQRELAGCAAPLLAAGLPDCRPETVVARFDVMVSLLAELPPGHPSHLDARGEEDLRGAAGLVRDAATVLADSQVPSSLQHGDLHARNVFDVGGELRLFDFGDSQWAHAFEVLVVPHAVVTHVDARDWPEVLDAYAGEWADVVDRDELESLVEAATVTHGVNRAQTWYGAVRGAGPQELADWGDAPLDALRRVLPRVAPR